MSSSCFQSVNCTSFFPSGQCSTAQPNSVNSAVDAAWTDSCQCPDSVIGLPPPGSNISCVNEVISYRFAPQNQHQKEICLETSTSVQTGVIAFIVVLNFGVPLLFLIYVLVRRTLEKKAKLANDEQATAVETATMTRPMARVTMENICFQIGEKQILKKVSASLEPGKLTAIMGPSGCGKSTLLDIIAFRGRGASSNVSGTVLVNGLPRGSFWKRISAYVEQFDALFPHLSVREMLTYTAELRSSSNATVDVSVNKVLRDLELEHVADTIIGDKFVKGISGGQARRVTVGLELLANPAVLLLDGTSNNTTNSFFSKFGAN